MTEITVAEVLTQVPVTRLAHFSPALNVLPVLRDGLIRSSKDLADNTPDSFTPTDRERFDAHPDHLCCSFEYPNGYYLRQARNKPHLRNYPDWVCFLINPGLVIRKDTLFCGCNAARNRGGYLRAGGRAMLDCWSNPSTPAGYPRRVTHHPAVPTDLQAEVLVPGPVELSDIQAIVVADEPTAAELFTFYTKMGHRPERLEWRIAPLFFDINRLASDIHAGTSVTELTWQNRGEA